MEEEKKRERKTINRYITEGHSHIIMHRNIMKTIFRKMALLSAFAAALAAAQTTHALHVMTFNIRLDVESDGANGWAYRKEMIVDLIRRHRMDIAGLQEVLPHQLDYLVRQLPEYGWFGVGRDDGKRSGEIMAVLFRKERLDTVRTSTIWCSENPGRPGKGWDAMCNRTITIGEFRDTVTRRTFHLLNTHFDHLGTIARRESAALLRRTIDATTGDEPAIVTGDFNSTPDSEPYRIMTEGEGRRKVYDSITLSQRAHTGSAGTFTGFDSTATPGAPIDFIFVTGGIAVQRHATLSGSAGGRLPSDHYPVTAEIVFEPEQ